MRFESPATVRGRELLFSNDKKRPHLLVRKGGIRLPFLKVNLDPHGAVAMLGNLCPVSEFGIKRMIERMIVLGEKELEYPECEVKIDPEFAFHDRSCIRIEVSHPVRREHFQYHLARILIDEEFQLPIRFESYDWPATEGDAPILKEEYTYQDLRLNVNLSDADFEPDNPEYRFTRREQ